jgi:hypothetical protein
MTTIRIAAAVIALALGLVIVPGHAAAQSQCKHTAAQYAQAIRHFEAEAAKARVLAVGNPLYESDLAYYASVLADAKACIRMIGPVATASR